MPDITPAEIKSFDVTDLAYDLIGVDDIDAALKQTLQKLGYRFGAQACSLLVFSDSEKQAIPQLQWVDQEKLNLDQVKIPYPLVDLQPILNQLSQVSLVTIEDLTNSLLDENIKNLLKEQNIQRCLWLPVPFHRILGGAIRIDNFSYFPDDSSLLGIQKFANSIGILWDKQSQSNLHQQTPKEENELLSLVFESLNLGVIVVSTDQKVSFVNNRAGVIFEKAPSYFQGKHLNQLEEIFPDGGLHWILRNLGFLKMGMSGEMLELHRVNSKDEGCDLEISTATLTHDNTFVGDLILVEDVTFRKNMERTAQESETRLRSVVQSIKEGITLSDTNGYFEIYNTEMEELTGFSRQEANQTESFIDKIHVPEERDQAKQQLANFSEGEKRISDITLLAKDGQKKYVSVSTTVLNTDNKRYYLSAYHDETAQKQAEHDLRIRNQELENLTKQLNKTADQLREARDHLEEKVAEKTQQLQAKVLEVEDIAKFPSEDPFPVMRICPDGRLLYANAASQALLDIWDIQTNQNVPQGWLELVKEVFETNNRKIYEIEILGQYISFVLVPVKESNYVNLYGRDVSREKELNQMKNQFIAMVSHQIRTPLTSVRWYSEMLLKGKGDQALSTKQAEFTQTIHETAVNLTSLVNDLLSISRMESGKIDYNPVRTDIGGLVEEVITELRPQAEKGKIDLTLEMQSKPVFEFDPKLIREVYLNLLSNAIKYTPENGQVKLRLRVEHQVLISEVADTGIGIPKTAQQDIFERFYRAQNAVDREFEGTGLGLSVAKMIVEKAGGKIWFESTEGEGTKFFFTLPLQNMV